MKIPPPQGVNIYMQRHLKILKNPFKTTTWPLNDRANVKSTIAKLEKKLFVYGVLSDREQRYWDQHNRVMFGQIRQKDTI